MPLSGSSWVSKFPTSIDVNDLVPPFRDNVKLFLAALNAAGASVTINATYRPAERAFLMAYAWSIAREGLSPARVPANAAIDIDWVHRYKNGRINYTASRQAAEDMVQVYDIAFKPALSSQHTRRLAIDITVGWEGDLVIINAQGQKITIKSEPRSGENPDLIAVGASYKVIKLVSDPPHWSVDGH